MRKGEPGARSEASSSNSNLETEPGGTLSRRVATAKSLFADRHRCVGPSHSNLPTTRDSQRKVSFDLNCRDRADSLSLATPDRLRLQREGYNLRHQPLSNAPETDNEFAGRTARQELESNQLSDELLQMRRERLKHCSYITSYSINSELDKIRGIAGRRKYLDKAEETARAISALFNMHLKRMNVKVENGSGLWVVDLDEIRRQRDQGKKRIDAEELRRPGLYLPRRLASAGPVESPAQQKANKQFVRRRRSDLFKITQQRLRKAKLNMTTGGNNGSWWNKLESKCTKQLGLNRSLDSK